jgi:hypothetical protein
MTTTLLKIHLLSHQYSVQHLSFMSGGLLKRTPIYEDCVEEDFY